MRRSSAVPVLVLLLVLVALAGCGEDSQAARNSSSPTTSETPSKAPSATVSPSSSASSSTASQQPGGSATSDATSTAGASGFPRDRTQATSLHRAVLASSVASTPAEKAAVGAWMAYWQGAADSYYFYRPTRQFSDVARGEARDVVLDYLQQQKADKQRVVGWARDHVTAVKVTGSTAKIRDCTENYTFTVDEEAEPVTLPTPYYDATGTLEKVDGRWMVTEQNSRDLNKSCLD